jgi:hypothetical protein
LKTLSDSKRILKISTDLKMVSESNIKENQTTHGINHTLTASDPARQHVNTSPYTNSPPPHQHLHHRRTRTAQATGTAPKTPTLPENNINGVATTTKTAAVPNPKNKTKNENSIRHCWHNQNHRQNHNQNRDQYPNTTTLNHHLTTTSSSLPNTKRPSTTQPPAASNIKLSQQPRTTKSHQKQSLATQPPGQKTQLRKHDTTTSPYHLHCDKTTTVTKTPTAPPSSTPSQPYIETTKLCSHPSCDEKTENDNRNKTKKNENRTAKERQWLHQP